MANGSAGFRGTDYQSYCAAIRILETILESGSEIVWIKFESEEDFTIFKRRILRYAVGDEYQITERYHYEFCQTKNEVYFPRKKLEGVLNHYLKKVGDTNDKRLLVYIEGNLGSSVVHAQKDVSRVFLGEYDENFLKRVQIVKLPCYPYILGNLRDFLSEVLGDNVSRKQIDQVRAHFIEGLNFLFGEKYRIDGRAIRQQVEEWKSGDPKWGTIFGVSFDRMKLEEEIITAQTISAKARIIK